MNTQALALAFLAATAIGGVAWVFVYPLLSGEKQAETRRASVAKPEPVAKRQNDRNQRSRREQVEGSLKDLEARRLKESKVPLSVRLTQADAERDLAFLQPAGLEVLQRAFDLLAARALVAVVLTLGNRFRLGDGGAPGLGLLLARQQGIDEDPCHAADG